MKAFLCSLFLVSFFVSGQKSYRKLSLLPHYSLGVHPPGMVETSGDQYNLRPKYSPIGIGIFDSNGGQGLSINSTHKWGLGFQYAILNNISINAGWNRTKLVPNYNKNFDFIITSNGDKAGDFTTFWRFNTYNLGIKLQGKQRALEVGLDLIPDMFGFINADANIVDDTYRSPVNNDALAIRFYDFKPQYYLVHLKYLKQASLIGDNTWFKLEANFNPATVFKANVNFIERGSTVSRNTLNFSANGIFFGIERPIRFKKREPKVSTPVKEKEIIVQKEKTPVKKEEEKPQKKEVEIGDKKIAVGEKLILNSIQFERSSAELLPSAQEELNQVLIMLQKYPEIRIELTGYTSNEGDKKKNVQLSKERAEACKTYLITRGANGERIKTDGLGPESPISRTNQELNRRVELKVLE